MNAKFMSESMYLGQVSISTDIRIKGSDNKIKKGLILINKRVFIKNTKDKNKKLRFNNKKPICHSFPNNILHNEIKNTGSVKKKGAILSGFISSLK